ncbi:hypothetical protein C8Q76DRAFT_785329 [Earliella scabrosa]|nr:hypothetical protein C8Q76DRAFT_785329 [Earliella scabrosa]
MRPRSDNENVIRNYGLFVRGQYFTVAARALFLWDYFVTLDREIEYVWGSRFSAATALFLLNRYLNLVITILELIVQAPFLTPQSCPPLVRVLQSLLIFATFIVALFFTLRVYATWSRDWRPALPILVLALVTPAANLYMDIVGTPIPAPRPSVGCAIRTNIEPAVYSMFVIVERATTTAYDFLILLFTLMKTAQVRKAALSLDLHPSIMTLLLRDGTAYFLLLFVMNIGQIIVASQVPGTNWIAFFASPLTSILITRFLLNLRQVARVADRLSPSGETSSPVISTQFPSVQLSTGLLGNLGAPLRSAYDSTDDHTEADGEFEDKLVYVDEPLLAGLVQVDEVRPDEVELQRFM